VSPVLPPHAPRINQAQVRLVHELRRLEAVTGPLALQTRMGDLMQLALHLRKQTLEC
jgi:hypothetical protein